MKSNEIKVMDRIPLMKKHPLIKLAHRPSHQDTKIDASLKISTMLVKYFLRGGGVRKITI